MTQELLRCKGCGCQMPDSGRGKGWCRDCMPSTWTEQVAGGIFMLQRHRNMAWFIMLDGKRKVDVLG